MALRPGREPKQSRAALSTVAHPRCSRSTPPGWLRQDGNTSVRRHQGDVAPGHLVPFPTRCLSEARVRHQMTRCAQPMSQASCVVELKSCCINRGRPIYTKKIIPRSWIAETAQSHLPGAGYGFLGTPRTPIVVSLLESRSTTTKGS